MQKDENKKTSLKNLFNDLYHPNPNISYMACKDLMEYWPVESIAILIDNLDDENIKSRRKAVMALGEFGIQALNPIIELFKSTKNEIIKISCLKIFIRIARDIDPCKIPLELISLIETSLNDDNPQMILLLTCLLRQLREGGIEFLKYLAKDSNVLRSNAAVSALSEINHDSIEGFLRELILDVSINELTRKKAIDSLNIYNL